MLDKIDSNKDGHYSEQEYLQAVHNVSYRDHLYRIIARNGSEWYYGKDDPSVEELSVNALVGELSGKLELSLLVRQRGPCESAIVKHWPRYRAPPWALPLPFMIT